MLSTRCPDCGTTFRVTDEDSTKADGQVRCGACACVFDAEQNALAGNNLMLAAVPEKDETPVAADPPEDTDWAMIADSMADDDIEADRNRPRGGIDEATEAAERTSGKDAAVRDTHPAFFPTNTTDAAAMPPAEKPPAVAPDTQPAESVKRSLEKPEKTKLRISAISDNKSTPPGGAASAAAQAAKLSDQAAAHPLGLIRPTSSGDTLDEAGVAAVLEQSAPFGPLHRPATPAKPPSAVPGDTAESTEPLPWQAQAAAVTARRTPRFWILVVVVAGTALTLQVINHFRSDLALVPVLRPALTGTYALFGIDLVPHWNVDQYQIVNSVATGANDNRSHDTLQIDARIRNNGPHAQPFPYLRVQLKDRWEKPLTSRVFQPSDYLSAGTDSQTLMSADDTVRAHLRVTDPGAMAYGFELDVCVESPDQSLHCANAGVFR